MSKEIVINAEKHQTRIAIVEGGELVELYIEDPDNKRTIGNIMLGRVRKVMPSIQAAFVDIGQDSDAFLHFSDVSDNLPALLEFVNMNKPDAGKVELPHPRRARQGGRRRPKGGKQKDGKGSGKNGNRRKADAQKRKGRRQAQKRSRKKSSRKSPEKLLKEGQTLLVKIAKEPIANKGSRVTTDISLAGRFLVLVPLTDFVAVSKKVSEHKERRRLRALAKSLVPNGFGVIVRTVAEGRNAKALDTDLRLLLERWRRLEKKLSSNPKPPALLHEDVDMVSSIIRDLFSSDYDRILIDDRRLHHSIRGYVKAVAPQMASKVLLHTRDEPVFETAGIHTGVERAFERRVELPCGGYLFIERTEAMHVIDVNSGRSGKGLSQEQNSLKVDLEAARMIAKQIRLRDLGGIIVVDFIDLRSEKNRKKIYDELKKEFKEDRAVTKVLPMSDFGLVQITRQRLRPSITTTFSSANGTSEESLKESPPKAQAPNHHEVQKLREKIRRQKDEMRRLRRSAEAPKEEVERLRSKVKHLEETAETTDSETETTDSKTEEPSTRPEELLETLEAWIADYKAQGHRRGVTLKVHPFTAAFLNQRMPNQTTRWFMRHLIRVRIEADETLSPLDFRFLDTRTGEELAETGERVPSESPPERARAAS